MVYLRFNNIEEFNNVIDAINNIHIILEITPLK